MKKITMSIAALAIAVMSYGQTCCEKATQKVITKEEIYKESVKTFKELDMRLDDIISAIRMDVFYGRITQENGKYYINEIMVLKSKNEDLMVALFKNKK